MRCVVLQYAGQPETADAVVPEAPGQAASSHVPSVLQKLLKWGNYAGYGTVSDLPTQHCSSCSSQLQTSADELPWCCETAAAAAYQQHHRAAHVAHWFGRALPPVKPPACLFVGLLVCLAVVSCSCCRLPMTDLMSPVYCREPNLVSALRLLLLLPLRQPVWPSRFIPMKTPLSEEILDSWELPQPPKHRLTVPDLLAAQAAAGRRVGLLLDLSNHDCLYASDVPSSVQVGLVLMRRWRAGVRRAVLACLRQGGAQL
jgi:hypothetical protein